ncbi:MAG: glucose-6-phosphate isomerase family protein [Bacillota bacterium]
METLAFLGGSRIESLTTNQEMVRIVKHLSDLAGIFEDEAAFKERVAQEDCVVYEYTRSKTPPESGQLCFGTSTIYPGRVGNEYFMTRGHYHARRGTGEVYLCVAGTGVLLMQTRDGQATKVLMSPGVIAYVPPDLAHRTVNTGQEPFICFYCFPANAGHDYEITSSRGFLVRVKDEKMIAASCAFPAPGIGGTKPDGPV